VLYNTLLVRMDSGNDSIENIKICLRPETKADWLIKRNLRKESPEKWLKIAKEKGRHIKEREGKDIYYGDTFIKRDDIETPLRILTLGCFPVQIIPGDKNKSSGHKHPCNKITPLFSQQILPLPGSCQPLW
jgi:hypothetical protein